MNASQMLENAHEAQRKTIRALEDENRRLREALQPFAKAGELFDPTTAYEMLIYNPAAGSEYQIVSKDLLRARATLSSAPPPPPTHAARREGDSDDALIEALYDDRVSLAEFAAIEQKSDPDRLTGPESFVTAPPPASGGETDTFSDAFREAAITGQAFVKDGQLLKSEEVYAPSPPPTQGEEEPALDVRPEMATPPAFKYQELWRAIDTALRQRADEATMDIANWLEKQSPNCSPWQLAAAIRARIEP